MENCNIMLVDRQTDRQTEVSSAFLASEKIKYAKDQRRIPPVLNGRGASFCEA